MIYISPMEHQSTKCNSIGTNGRVEWTTTQTGALKDILSLYNGMHFTNGTPIDKA